MHKGSGLNMTYVPTVDYKCVGNGTDVPQGAHILTCTLTCTGFFPSKPRCLHAGVDGLGTNPGLIYKVRNYTLFKY
jgi:hypothetical protein